MSRLGNKRRCYDEDIYDYALNYTADIIRVKSNLDKGIFSEYNGRIFDFCKDKLGIELTDPQILVAESLENNTVTNCKACHSVGKSNFAACVIFYWTLVKNGLVVTTAPTLRQVKGVLWAEAKRLYVKNSLPGTMLTLEYKVNEFCYATGFTGSKENESSVAGVHYENLLGIIDEANGIDASIDEGIQSMVSGAKNKLLRISNPLVPFTAFYYACKNEGCITLRAFDHPNVAYMYETLPGNKWPTLKPEIKKLITDDSGNILPYDKWPKSPLIKPIKIPSAVNVEYIEKKRSLGETSNIFLSRVCGEFPIGSDNPLFFEYLLEQCIYKNKNKVPLSEYNINYDLNDFISRYKKFCSCKVLGIDVGESVDPHSISVWYDYLNTKTYNIPVIGDHRDIQRLEDHILKYYPANEGWILYIDGIGVGSKLPGDMLNHGYVTEFVSWGEKATQDGQEFNYRNLKTQHIFNASQAIKELKPLTLEVPNYEELQEEFLAHTYLTLNENLIGIIKKSDVKKMLDRSPNTFDSYVLGLNGVIEHSMYNSFQDKADSIKGRKI